MSSTDVPTPSCPAWLAETSRRIGRYRLGPSLGKGGMGEVFEAWDGMLGRRVALKLLSSWGASATLRLLQEAKHQARVEHPNVCRVLDLDIQGDLPFIAMQLVQGPTLKEARLGPREAAEVIQKVAEAVHAAHRLNLIHRDLKPTNILLERSERGAWVPFVCDFGLSKDLGSEPLTLSHSGVGTPAFMAPEQLFHHGARAGVSTDIYALGATLYDTLTGQPPITRLEGHTQGDRPRFQPPHLLNPAIPKPLEQILLRCLEWDPGDRYPTAAALAEDLRRFLDGEVLQPRVRGLMGGLRWLLRRHPWPFAGATLGLLLMLGMAGAITWSQGERARQTRMAERFTGAIKDLQYQMRIERMLPSHDLRPGFSRVRARMAEIRSAMKELGSASKGPGCFALGWGHLLLREPGEALAAFRSAWTAGYQTPEVAAAWAHAHCDAYAEALPTARQRGGPALEALKRQHLEPARALLASAAESRLELPSQLQAQLETLDRNPERALTLARSALAAQGVLYELRVWEAAALTDLGFAHQLAGRYAEAEARYREADVASQQAQTIARSDELALKVELNRRLAWIAVKDDAGGASRRDFEALEALADRLLALNPEWLPAVADKLTVLWRLGDFELSRGRNPEAVLQRGMALIEATRRLPGAIALLQRDRASLCDTLAEWLYEQGLDPRPTIATGLEGVTPDENTAGLLVLRARWSMDHGLDPGPDLSKAMEGVDHPTFQRAEEYGLASRRVMIGRWAATWALKHGQDPREALDTAIATGRAGLAANPRSSDLLMETAACLELNYQARARIGSREPALLREGLADARLADQLRHSAATTRYLSSVELGWAEHALAVRGSARPWLDRAARHLQEARRKHPTHPELRALQARLASLRLRTSTWPLVTVRPGASGSAAAPVPPPPG